MAYHAVGGSIAMSRVAEFSFAEALQVGAAFDQYTKKIDALTKLQERLIDQMSPEVVIEQPVVRWEIPLFLADGTPNIVGVSKIGGLVKNQKSKRVVKKR